MFSRILAQNFLSWENLDFSFDRGTTLIEGWNADENTSEGSGKSAILNALCWCLYGKIPKDANIDDVIKEGEKSCLVQVFLEDGSVVARSRKPNTLCIIGPDGEEFFGKDARETQILIDNHIGMSFDTFCQSVYFAQNYTNKFITAGETDKTKILSEILDLKVFDRARDAVGKELKKMEIEVAVAQKTAFTAAQAVEMAQNHVNDYVRLVNEFKADHSQRLQQIQAKIDVEVERLDALKQQQPETTRDELTGMRQKMRADLEVLNEKDKELAAEVGAFNQALQRRRSLENSLNRQNERVKAAAKKLAAFQSGATPACPTCGRDFAEDDAAHAETLKMGFVDDLRREESVAADLQSELGSLPVSDLPDLSNKRKAYSGAMTELKADLDFVEQNLAALQRAELDLARCQDTIAALNEQYAQEWGRNSDKLEEKLEESQLVLTEKESAWNESEEVFTRVRDEAGKLGILRDSFKEIKSYVFQGVLDELTRRSNLYLGELFEVPIRIDFNNQGEGGETSKITTAVTIHDVQRPLGLYSGGQSRRLQLAVDLALSDIISARGAKPIPLRVMDEYFKDLSTESMEKILGLLERLPGSTILVEHNQLFKSIVNRVFNVHFENGTSRADFQEGL